MQGVGGDSLTSTYGRSSLSLSNEIPQLVRRKNGTFGMTITDVASTTEIKSVGDWAFWSMLVASIAIGLAFTVPGLRLLAIVIGVASVLAHLSCAAEYLILKYLKYRSDGVAS